MAGSEALVPLPAGRANFWAFAKHSGLRYNFSKIYPELQQLCGLLNPMPDEEPFFYAMLYLEWVFDSSR